MLEPEVEYNLKGSKQPRQNLGVSGNHEFFSKGPMQN